MMLMQRYLKVFSQDAIHTKLVTKIRDAYNSKSITNSELLMLCLYALLFRLSEERQTTERIECSSIGIYQPLKIIREHLQMNKVTIL